MTTVSAGARSVAAAICLEIERERRGGAAGQRARDVERREPAPEGRRRAPPGSSGAAADDRDVA